MMPRLVLLLTLLLTGCQSAGLALLDAPVSIPTSRMRLDVAYGDRADQRMDLYYPDYVERTDLPLIIFFYGGRWENGEREQYRFIADTLTRHGYMVAIPDYRKYPAVKFPAFVEDAAQAVAHLHRNAPVYGIDPSRLFVLGHSAGAHIGALLAADPHYLEAEGGTREWIAAFAGLAGPYAFTPDEPDLKAIFGPPKRYPAMQVPTFIDGKQPPMLLLHGVDDTDVKPVNLTRLRDAITKKGGTVKTRFYPGMDHIDILTALSWIGRDRPVLDDVNDFFRNSVAP